MQLNSISAPFNTGSSYLFAGTLESVKRRCGAGKPENIGSKALGNLGVYQVVTAGFTAEKWGQRGFAHKTAHVFLHAIGAALQAAAWVPFGAAATVLGAALFLAGKKGAAALVLDKNLYACTFVACAADVAIMAISSLLFLGWVRSFLLR